MITTYEDLYSMFRNIVFSSTTKKLPRCKEIQTFAVLDEYQQASREQLTKTIPEKFKPYFFSHKWHDEGYPAGNISFEYPLLAVMPSSSTVNGIGGGNNCDTQFALDIVVLDYFSENIYDKYANTCNSEVMPFDFVPCNYPCDYDCDERNIFEIYKDTSLLLQDFLFQITNVGVYINIKNEKRYYLINEYAESLKDIYIKDNTASIQLNTLLKKSLRSVNIDRWSGGIANLYGSLINGLTFSL